jgi:xanthine dehydrogenase molybdenum-binding subunit
MSDSITREKTARTETGKTSTGKTSGLRYVGKRIPRSDGPDKVQGRYDCLADTRFDGALCGVVLFSPHAHARVKSIDTKGALAIPGVSVLTFEDAPATRYNSGEWFPGHEDFPDETLLTGHVRHVGDRIALVLGPDEPTARLAREYIVVEYEELPPVIDPLRAQNPVVPLHEDGQSAFPGRLTYGDVDAAFEAAARVAEDTIVTQKIHHAAMETHAVLAIPRPEGVLEVQTPCQILFGVQHVLAQGLGLPLSKIHVVKARMGGAFGGKQEVVFEALCAWAALKLRKPVFINTNREETMLATRTRTAVTCKIATALDADGKILGRRFDVTADAGAYLSGTKKVMMAMGKKTPRLYRVPALLYEARAVRTSTTPAGACRGYGSPQIHTITEIHTDLLCRRLNIDPVEFRLKNLVYPYDDDPSGASNLGNARIRDCLTRGTAAFGWENRAKPLAFGRFRRAAGFACCTHGNGYFGTIYHDFTGMSLRILEDGSAVLRTGLHELGNGTLTAMAQIVAEVTGIPPERVAVTEGDSQFSGYDAGCQASRVIYVCGECARRCAEEAVKLLCLEMEKLLDRPVFLENGYVRAGEDRVPLGGAVRRIALKNRVAIDVYVEYRPMSNPGSYGAHFADVTVDTLTGLVKVNDYLAVHDVGRAINPDFVEGQICGGVQMGIGMALMEELAFDAKGRPSARNFDKYHMINAPDMPPVNVILVEEGEDGGPFGAKSIGEIAATPVAPAVVNAVNRALGTELTTLPLTPEKIVRALSPEA